MNITINVPDQLGTEINQLPNRDQMATQALRKMLEEYRHSMQETTTPTKQKGKWAKFAENIELNKDKYRGVSEQVQKDSKEFRENFIFNDDK
jgi:hypothetical protein